jgi:hypothetical protein
MKWDQPHWSGRPQLNEPPRRKLRPNGFARLARLAARYATTVVVLAAILAGLTGGFAVSRLEIDPDQRPRISLDETTAELQAALDRAFPGIEQTFLALVSSRDPETARQQALALAATLSQRNDLFLSAFVPGTGGFYDTHGLLYRDNAEVNARVDALLRMEPLYHALAAAPDIMGFASLVREIGTAVEQGRSPPGLAEMLLAVSAAIEAQVKGKPRPVRWEMLAGLDGGVQAKRWYVLATPVPGKEREAAAAARQASQGMQEVRWLWPRRALASAPSTLRDFVVPASLSVLLTLVLLWAGLGSVRQAAAVMLCAAVTLGITGAAAALLGRPLDGATWSFALAVLAPVIVAGGVTAVAYGQGRSRGLAPDQAVMLAAQRQGGFVTAVVLLFAAVWVAWMVRQLPSLGHFAAIALVGCAATWLAVLLVLPAALRLTATRQAETVPHWLDDGVGDSGGPQARTAADLVAVAVLAVAVFSAIFLPAMRFGERQLPSSPPPLLETPDSRGAVHILAPAGDVPELVNKLSDLPEVGAIRTAAQFLPPDAEAKVAVLRRLAAFTPFEPAPRSPPDNAVLRESFADLQEQLASIAQAPASSDELRAAATRLRRALELFAAPQPPTRETVASLEAALFGGLGDVSQLAQGLAALKPPAVSDLDPQLLRRFVSPDGIWRIEVLPRGGIGELSFAAALRRAVPQAAGEPVVALVRNEMIHHETYLAIAAALVAAAVLALAALRSLRGLIITVAPAAAFITLSAAVTVLLGISLNAAMLAGISAAMAVLMACSMLLARRFATAGAPVKPAALPLRAALLAPVTLAFAAAPLMISSRPAVAELGAALTLIMMIVAVLAALLVPAMARWLAALAEPAVSTPRPE